MNSSLNTSNILLCSVKNNEQTRTHLFSSLFTSDTSFEMILLLLQKSNRNKSNDYDNIMVLQGTDIYFYESFDRRFSHFIHKIKIFYIQRRCLDVFLNQKIVKQGRFDFRLQSFYVDHYKNDGDKQNFAQQWLKLMILVFCFFTESLPFRTFLSGSINNETNELNDFLSSFLCYIQYLVII